MLIEEDGSIGGASVGPMEHAKDLYKDGRFLEAISVYSSILEQEQDDKIAKVYVHRGNAFAELARSMYFGSDKEEAIKSAIGDYNAAIGLDENDGAAYCGRGITREMLGDSEGAIKDFNEAVSLDAYSAGFRYNRGIFYADQGGALNGIPRMTKENIRYLDMAVGDLREALKLNQSEADEYQKSAIDTNSQRVLEFIASTSAGIFARFNKGKHKIHRRAQEALEEASDS